MTEHFPCLWSPLSNKWRQDLGIQFQLERNPPEKQRDVILIEKSIVLWTIAQIEVAWGGGKSGTTKDKVLSQSSANIQTFLINTDGALRPPTTYDIHAIHPTLPIPSVRHIALNHLNRPWIDLSRPQVSHPLPGVQLTQIPTRPRSDHAENTQGQEHTRSWNQREPIPHRPRYGHTDWSPC